MELVSGSTPEWKVVREDGEPGDFDPGTLINSVIESEVPAPIAVELYIRFLKKAESRIHNGQLTYSAIRSLVSEVFLEHDDPDRSVWFANYESLFAPSSGDTVGDAFVSARNPGYLKEIIEELLSEELGSASASGLKTVRAVASSTRLSSRYSSASHVRMQSSRVCILAPIHSPSRALLAEATCSIADSVRPRH